MIPFPAALDAYTDTRLGKTERRIYRVALLSLDLQSYRPLKLTYLKRRTGIAVTHCCTARRLLTELGYLERQGFAYRLSLNLPSENTPTYEAA